MHYAQPTLELLPHINYLCGMWLTPTNPHGNTTNLTHTLMAGPHGDQVILHLG